MPEAPWSRVESLFHLALQLSPDERDKFVEQACQGDARLQEEVLSLVSHYNSADELLEKMGVPPLDQDPVFQPGERVGLFEIIGLLGKGGMGEVYLARDPRLERKVALKVLPKALSNRAMIERLQREARAVSALSHPNILTIYDFGRQDGLEYMVTEFVEGQSLREYIGKLSAAEALNYAREIGEALKSAHAAGIVHRDIKPENIMVRSDGYIKVLDFGLAKPAHLQWEQQAVSVPGMLVGTIQYMSPEQVRGQAIDQRSDIWAWGVVLYEMLKGERPFAAPTPGDTLAAVLNHAPSPPTNDKKLNRIAARALAKLPQERYQSMQEALDDLARVSAQPGRFKKTMRQAVAAERFSSSGKLLVLALAVLLLAAAAAYRAYLMRASSGGASAMHLPLHVESVVPLTSSGNALLSAISPDEQWAAYVTQESGGRQALWRCRLGSNTETTRLADTSGKYIGITFSPDGEYLYYVLQQEAAGKLYRMRLSDGWSTMVHEDVASPISFSPDGLRYAFSRVQESKSQIVVARTDLGPEAEKWTAANPDSLGYPVWSPDGCCLFFSVLYSSGVGPANIRFISMNVASGQYTETARQPWYYVGRPVWLKESQSILISATRNDSNWARLWEVSLSDGKITSVFSKTFDNLDAGKSQRQVATVEWVRHSTPWLVPLDHPENAKPVPGLQGVYYGLAWTKSGNLISQSDAGGEPDLWSIEPASGKVTRITHDQGVKESPAISPDGHSLVYDSNRDGAFALWRSGLDGGNPVRLTVDTFPERQPAITPDGKWVIYTSFRSGSYRLWKVALQGGGTPIQFTARKATRAAVSPDGALVLCNYDDPKLGWSTAILDEATGKPVLMLPAIPASEKAPAIWSANGKSVLYVQTQNGVSNVWRQPLHGGPARQLTHFTEGRIFYFALSPDGRSLACVRGSESKNAVLLRMTQ